MKTELTQQKLDFYNALCENMNKHKHKSSNDYYLHRLFKAIPIKDKSYEEIDFLFELDPKRKFIDDSVLLFSAMNFIYVGKIRNFFWMIDEYENVYFIYKSIVEITNILLSENCGLRIDEDIESFFHSNKKFYKNGDFKEYLEEYKKFAKQYGYNFELMKDIYEYPDIKKDMEEFNKLLASYGIVNEEE